MVRAAKRKSVKELPEVIDWKRVEDLIRNASHSVLLKAVSGVDGWTIYTPSKFLDAGLDEYVVRAYTRTLESGDHPKEQITDLKTGKPVESMQGVYGLSLLERIADVFQVFSDKNGRGSRANDLLEQLIPLWAIDPVDPTMFSDLAHSHYEPR